MLPFAGVGLANPTRVYVGAQICDIALRGTLFC